MTTLCERLTVHCPYVRARDYLAAMLNPQGGNSGEERLTLTAPLDALGGGNLEKAVIVRYWAGADPMHFDQPWHVSWTPEHGGPFPDFDGELTVRADEGYGTAVLELTGSYKPPLGAAGRAFDAAIGHRIASATAQRLLAEIGDRMRERYEREEAAKIQPR